MTHRVNNEERLRGRETMALEMSSYKRKRMHGMGGYTSHRNGNRDRVRYEVVVGKDGRKTLRFLPKQYPIRKTPQKMMPEPISLCDALEQLNAL
jgi:hypothetical protein